MVENAGEGHRHVPRARDRIGTTNAAGQRLSPASKSLADKIVRDVRAMTNFELQASKLTKIERDELLYDRDKISLNASTN